MRGGVGLLATALLAAAAGMVRTATRLDRLHVRVDAGWAALDAALGRRALVALGAGPAVPAHPAAAAVSAAAATALACSAGDLAQREEAENELGRALGALGAQHLAGQWGGQLTDAQQRVVIARRVYNDAVRDTLALREKRTVRWLRLAGTAPLPRYFEIVEPDLPPTRPGAPVITVGLPGGTASGQDGAGA